MNLQEIINYIESLPTEERDYLFEFLRKKMRNKGDRQNFRLKNTHNLIT
jgi:hypothetical protein